MRVVESNTITITFTEQDVDKLVDELDDLGFGATDGNRLKSKKQPDERWPCLAQLNEYLNQY